MWIGSGCRRFCSADAAVTDPGSALEANAVVLDLVVAAQLVAPGRQALASPRRTPESPSPRHRRKNHGWPLQSHE